MEIEISPYSDDLCLGCSGNIPGSNFMLPTAASRNKMTNRSPSPSKRTPWRPPSPSGPLPELTPNARSVAGVKSAYAAVASPVAAYVKNNPAPHLVQ